jgi:phage regulator Rha-like protein
MRQATSPTEYALPNQEQTLLLLIFMQNTAKVVQFKLDLTHAFRKMSQALKNI